MNKNQIKSVCILLLFVSAGDLQGKMFQRAASSPRDGSEGLCRY